jgi:hypothetical protein
MAWMERRRLKERDGLDPHVLEYPFSTLVFGVVVLVFFLAFPEFLSLFEDVTASIWSTVSTITLTGFAFFGVKFIGDYARVRYQVEPEGLAYRTLFRSGFLRWADIRRIHYSHIFDRFRVEGQNGKVIRLSKQLMSLSSFASTVLHAVPVDRMNPDTVEILKYFAAGPTPYLPRKIQDTFILKYPFIEFLSGVIGLCFFLPITVLSIVYPNNTGSVWTTILFLGFDSLCAIVIVRYIRVRHHIEPEGLAYQTFLGKRGFLRWEDVAQIRYTKWIRRFRIEGQNGEVISLSIKLMPLSAFANAALFDFPMKRMDPDTVDKLEQIAAG